MDRAQAYLNTCDTNPDVSATAPQLRSLIDQAAGFIQGLDPELAAAARQLRDLSLRLQQERFHLAVLGQFKRGKSTLLNALLGEPLLPSAVVPLTSIPTFIHAGPRREARVLFQDDERQEKHCCERPEEMSAFLSRFVAEEHNPKNSLGVRQVDVFHTAPILQKGVVLIDTPGIGSTFRHNTEATLNFLPQCDAALFVVSADPPVTEVEIEFLRQVQGKVTRLFFVLNKVDYLSVEEKEQAAGFFKMVLREQLGFSEDIELFCLSARQGLEAASRQDAALWGQSGLGELNEFLAHFLVEGKASALSEAVSRKAADVLGEVAMRLDLELRALEMPLADLAARKQVFEEKLVEIRQQQETASDLLAGDKKRMYQFLEDKAEALRQRAIATLEQVVDAALAVVKGSDYHLPTQEALDNEVPRFFEHELGVLIGEVDRRLSQVLRPHQERANQLIANVRQTAAQIFEVPFHAPESEGVFEAKRGTYWITAKWLAAINPIPPIHLDRLLPAGLRQVRVRKRLLGQIQDIARRNVGNARWATQQNLDRAFLRFGSALRVRLEETVAATYGAIEAASRRRQERSEEVAGEVERLKSASTTLGKMRAKLASLATG
jgi:predicted GTPase